jgi:hypothetical protein
MRRLILTGMALAIASLGVAQETLASRNPVQTVGGYSAHRYVSEPATLPPGGIDSPIPLCETKRVLDELVESMVLSKNVEAWVDEALGTVMTLNKEDVAVSFIELCRESNGPPHLGSFQGDIPMYASGASKVVYAIALGHKLQQNNGRVGGKMRSDLHAMLADGSAEATNRIVDAVSGTESGDELSGGDFRSFTKKRNYANWMFQCVGFQNFNVNQKMWVGDPSPRDLQLLGAKQNLNYVNSNRMTSNQAAALLFLLNENAVISSKFSCQLKDDMTRQVTQVKRGALSGIAAGLPHGSRMVGIQGYTKQDFNDIQLVTLPNARSYILAVMTRYNETPTNFVPNLSRIVSHRMMTKTGDDNIYDGGYLARPLAGTR